MKRTLAILMLFTLLFQSLAHYSVMALFELRKDFIVQNLCENRSKPELKCCGKCFLKKQLKAVDDNDHSKDKPLKVEKQEIIAYILPTYTTVERTFIPFSDRSYNPGQQHLNGYDPIQLIFHPPPFIIA